MSGGARDGPLVEELVPAPDPLACCERLARLPYRILLDSAHDSVHDSAAAPSRLGRHSFLAADPPMLVWSKGAHTERITLANGSRERLSMDALSAVRDVLAPHATPPIPGLPPFQGGRPGMGGVACGASTSRTALSASVERRSRSPPGSVMRSVCVPLLHTSMGGSAARTE